MLGRDVAGRAVPWPEADMAWSGPEPGSRAVVVGAGVAGLLTARALRDHVETVEVLDRDRLDGAGPRAHVPQGRQGHALLGAGEQLMGAWFPGLVDDLVAGGAVRVGGERIWWHQAGGYRIRGDWGGGPRLHLTRPYLEHALRERVAGMPGVRIRDRSLVEGVITAGGRVTGVRVGGAPVPADLVVDCGGRSSRLVHALSMAGTLRTPVSEVVVNVAYATRLLRRSPDDLDGDVLVVTPSFPTTPRGGVAVPVEGGRWQVTLAGWHGEAPPADDDGFRAFARHLGAPVLAELIERCHPVGPVASYALRSSRWRHFERAADLPPGYVAVGDAVASFDPVYGQGMSTAALQAQALGDAVARWGAGSDRLPREHHRRAARAVRTAWAIAVGADFADPRTTGPKPFGTDVLNRYVGRVLLATHTSLPVQQRLSAVQNLQATPGSLLRPGVALRVLVASRRSPAVTGLPVPGPRIGPPRHAAR